MLQIAVWPVEIKLRSYTFRRKVLCDNLLGVGCLRQLKATARLTISLDGSQRKVTFLQNIFRIQNQISDFLPNIWQMSTERFLI